MIKILDQILVIEPQSYIVHNQSIVKTYLDYLLKNNWLIFLLLLTFSLLIYSSNINGQFVLDDPPNIISRTDIRQLSSIPKLLTSPYTFNSPESGAYRPFLMISIALDYAFFQTSTPGYHLTNITLHATAGFLLYLLAIKLTKKPKLALLASLLFLAHPLHTEAVNSIVNRSEILGAIFAFLALSFSLQKNKNWKDYLIINSSVLLALLSKESAIYLIPLIVALEFVPFEFSNISHHLKTKILNTIFLTLNTGLYFYLRYLALNQYIFSNSATLVENPLNYVTNIERVATSFKILVLYLIKVIFPLQLSADYSFNQIEIVGVNNPLAIVGIILLLFVFIFWLWSFFKSKKLFLSLGLVILPYFITSNILLPIGTIMAERLLYTSIAGIILTIIIILNKYICHSGLNPESNKNKIAFLAFFFLLLTFSARTFIRNFAWRNQYNLFTSTAQNSPNSVLARSNAGAIYILNGQLEKGKAESQAAYQIYDSYGANNYNLGYIALMENNVEQAEKWFTRTIEVADYYSLAYWALAKLYYYQQDFGQLDQLITNHPDKTNHPSIQLYQILAKIKQDQLDVAIQLIESQLTVNSAEYYQAVGFTLLKEGNLDQTHQALIKAINTGSNDEELFYQATLSYLRFKDTQRANQLLDRLNKSVYKVYSQPLLEKLCTEQRVCIPVIPDRDPGSSLD